MKKLPAGMERFIVKKVDKAWRIYDKARGSYPVTGAEWGGTVQQDVPEKTALEEAARLNGELVAQESIQADKKKPAREAPAPARESIQADSVRTADDELPIKESDIPDYGVMSAEERAAYEDGLIEKVTY